MERLSNTIDAPEEVVRAEKHEVSAEVAIARHRVVLALRHVLVMAREDDQAVQLREPVAGDALDVVLGEHVDLAPRVREPAQEGVVVAPELRRHAAVEERAQRVDGRALVPPVVPGVRLAVTVGVAVVVGLPRIGRLDHRDGCVPRRLGLTMNGAKPTLPPDVIRAV